MSFTYQLEFGRTLAQPAFFCGVFRVCELEAQNRLTQQSRTASLAWRTTRNRANSFSNPDRGYIFQVEAKHASPMVGSDPRQQFNRALIDVARYQRAGKSSVLVLRLRAGSVIGSRIGLTDTTNTTFIPLQERMYGGGPNSLRGYQQNELGEALYVPTKFDVVPITDTTAYWRAYPADTNQSQQVVPSGGDNVVVANAEVRLRSPILPDLVQYALFVDVGEVWNKRRDGIGAFGSLKVTPGVGVRLFSPIGPVRVDIGYNPYNRPAGRAYFTPQPGAYTSGSVLELICVSPSNALIVHTTKAIGSDGKPFPPRQEAGTCDASYIPTRRNSLFSRLTFQFSIGQAF
jgi:outer membrane protein assembly factor BamA